MKRLAMIPFLTVLFLLWQNPTASAQYLQAGVQEFKTPVRAYGFQLKALDGREVSLQAMKGKVVILNFYTTW